MNRSIIASLLIAAGIKFLTIAGQAVTGDWLSYLVFLVGVVFVYIAIKTIRNEI